MQTRAAIAIVNFRAFSSPQKGSALLCCHLPNLCPPPQLPSTQWLPSVSVGLPAPDFSRTDSFCGLVIFCGLASFVRAKLLQPCPTLCEPTDRHWPGSSVHGDSPGEHSGVGAMPSFHLAQYFQGSSMSCQVSTLHCFLCTTIFRRLDSNVKLCTGFASASRAQNNQVANSQLAVITCCAAMRRSK